MADKPFAGLGTEFASWQNVPSITESFQKMAEGKFNPLGYAIGYGLNKITGGDNPALSAMMDKQQQALTGGVAPPQQASAVPPAVPAVPPIQPITPQTQPSVLPSYDEMRNKIKNLIGVQ